MSRWAIIFAMSLSALITGCVNRGHGLHNFGVADLGVYRGAQPSTNALQTLNYLGVKAVLDLTGDTERHTWEGGYCALLGMAHFWVPMKGLSAPTENHVKDCLKLLLGVRGPIYVHCVYGSDRTSAVIAAWKRQRYHTDKAELLAEAKSYGLAVPAIEEFIEKLP